jgi:hypothetical protein
MCPRRKVEGPEREKEFPASRDSRRRGEFAGVRFLRTDVLGISVKYRSPSGELTLL